MSCAPVYDLPMESVLHTTEISCPPTPVSKIKASNRVVRIVGRVETDNGTKQLRSYSSGKLSVFVDLELIVETNYMVAVERDEPLDEQDFDLLTDSDEEDILDIMERLDINAKKEHLDSNTWNIPDSTDTIDTTDNGFDSQPPLPHSLDTFLSSRPSEHTTIQQPQQPQQPPQPQQPQQPQQAKARMKPKIQIPQQKLKPKAKTT